MSTAQQSSLYPGYLPGMRWWLLAFAACLVLVALILLFAHNGNLQLPIGSTTDVTESGVSQSTGKQKLLVLTDTETSETFSLPKYESELSDRTGKPVPEFDGPDNDAGIFDAAHGHYPQADFSRTNLHSANFYRASVADASFDGALLMHATLRVANIRHSRFLDADLSFSDLGDSEATGAVFNGAVLRHANASRSNLIGTSFEYANMFAINLQQSWLLKASLRGAVLADAQLSEANLQHVDFTHTDLSGADLSGADLRYSNITERQLATACGSKKTLLPETLQNYTMRACP